MSFHTAYPTAAGPEGVLSVAQVLQRHHPDLKQSLDIDAIHPYLNKYGLLTQDQGKKLMRTKDRNKTISKLLEWLPMKGSDFLEKFIKCLRESADGTGTGHTELAETLEKASRVHTQTTAGDTGLEDIPGNIQPSPRMNPHSGFSAPTHTSDEASTATGSTATPTPSFLHDVKVMENATATGSTATPTPSFLHDVKVMENATATGSTATPTPSFLHDVKVMEDAAKAAKRRRRSQGARDSGCCEPAVLEYLEYHIQKAGDHMHKAEDHMVEMEGHRVRMEEHLQKAKDVVSFLVEADTGDQTSTVAEDSYLHGADVSSFPYDVPIRRNGSTRSKRTSGYNSAEIQDFIWEIEESILMTSLPENSLQEQ